MTYKLSRYNNIMWHGEQAYLWNSFSNALLKLDAEALMFLERYEGTDMSGNIYFDIFLRNGCLVAANLDELNKVLREEKQAIHNPYQKVLHLTIAPGLGCNYNCVYCFEKDRASHVGMSSDMQEKTAAFILWLAENNPNLEYLMIRWFGGEPLLYMDAIKKISERLIPWCEEHNIRYYAEIITNGRFLTKENAILLRQCRIQFGQIAVDGMTDYYIAQKRAKKEDFDATVDNIALAADILPIQVRINLTDNFEEALALTRYLLIDRKLDRKIKMRLAHVRFYDHAASEKEIERHIRFMDYEREYIKLFGKAGPYSSQSLSLPFPRRQPANCYKICGLNFCIGPEGELYRCEHWLGRKELSSGNIQSFQLPEHEIQSINFNRPKKCLSCSILPVCLSGCLVYPNLALACDQYKEERFQLLLRNCKSS